MKREFKIKGMHCNSCERLIEDGLGELKGIDSVQANYSRSICNIDFDDGMISGERIKEKIKELGYEVDEKGEIREQEVEQEIIVKEKKSTSDKIGFWFMISAMLVSVFFIYKWVSSLNISIPGVGEQGSLILLFAAGLLTGFHCISMCGGFVVSYTTKNALKGHKSFKQHLVYGGSKLVSYALIGGLFGLIGGIIAFSVGLRGWIAISAGVFIIFYSLSMFGFKFFRRFQFNPKFLSKFSASASKEAEGYYKAPLITGLLSGLFIACGPLQAMYLYAMGSGSFFNGALSLAAFGLGTLPIMIGFGSFATVISHKTTKKILKFSAIIVLVLGLIMLNRGLTVLGSSVSYDSIKAKVTGETASVSSAVISGDVQEVNMDVDASGYSPNSFVLKKGIPVKWNVNVKQLTGCNEEIVMNAYGIDVRLKQGMNIINFTPDKAGTISFSCGMGMLRGSFVVTDNGTATQQQVQAATPSSSRGCGCGGGSSGTCGA